MKSLHETEISDEITSQDWQAKKAFHKAEWGDTPCSHLAVDVFEDAFNVLVLPDQLDGALGADASDGVAVVTAQQDAQVDELEPEPNSCFLTINCKAASDCWWNQFFFFSACFLGVYVPCIYRRPGGVIIVDSGLRCCGPAFNVWRQLFERNYFPLFVDSSKNEWPRWFE